MRVLTILLSVLPFGVQPAFSVAQTPPSAPQAQSISLGADGHLAYAPTAKGDHILDFSYAGYGGGGIAIPEPPVAMTLEPTGGDDTAALQSALDTIAAKPRHGTQPLALQLAAGTFHLSNALLLKSSGVVLRGAGRGKTILTLTGKPHVAIQVALSDGTSGSLDDDSPASPSAQESTSGARVQTTLADIYIPSGVRHIPVVSTGGFQAGDTIVLKRPIPPAYTAFMGMDHMVRDGKAESWVSGPITTERRVVVIKDGSLWLDVPLSDDFDPRFGGGAGTTVTKVSPPLRLHDVGIESLSIRAAAQAVDYHEEHFDGIHISDAEDLWLRDLDLTDTVNFVRIESSARRITIDRVNLLAHDEVTSAARPFGFSLGGTQILVMRSSARGNKLTFAATQSRMQGPNVVLSCDFTGDGNLEPHQRWSTGFLVDNVQVHGGGIHYINRGEMGSGHGWTTGWSVVWNSSADVLTVQEPPGAVNWVIGSSGRRTRQGMPIKGSRGHNGPDLPEGIYESYGKPVSPKSLYLQQLSDRLGPQAVHDIGW